MATLDMKALRDAVSGSAAALRCVTEYQPAGGTGDKVFPPTYEGGKYAMEKRRLPAEMGGGADPVDCVLLDSVQSQANRMEMALLEAWERAKDDKDGDAKFPLPVITVAFSNNDGLKKVLRITSLEAPHRIADALLRDSLHNGTPFRKSDIGKRLDDVDNRNASALFELCPTTLVFGMWDSTGPKGGLGAKFQRALVSEIVGIGVTAGVKTSSRIDPAQIRSEAGPIYRAADQTGIAWTLDEKLAERKGGKPQRIGDGKKAGKPSAINHSNIPPSMKDAKTNELQHGGVTLTRALQTTVLSLPALRRLRFPINGKFSPAMDDAARTALAALGLCAATLSREQGCDLRSRCLLVPTSGYEWELLGSPSEQPKRFSLSGEVAIKLFRDAVADAKKAGLPWMEKELTLTPSPELVALVKKSQELSAATGGDGEDGGTT